MELEKAELAAKENLESHDKAYSDRENDLAVHKLYEVGEAANADELVGGYFGRRKIKSAKAMGYSHGEYEGCELQLPAVFIISPDGTVKKACRARSVAVMPTAKKVCAMLE